MIFAHGESINVTRPGSATGTYDAQGNPILSPVSTFTVDGVGVAPTSSDEASEEFGPRSVNGYTLYLPYGTELRAGDRVALRGESGWQVEGDSRVVDWRSPFTGWEAGTVAVVRRAS